MSNMDMNEDEEIDLEQSELFRYQVQCEIVNTDPNELGCMITENTAFDPDVCGSIPKHVPLSSQITTMMSQKLVGIRETVLTNFPILVEKYRRFSLAFPGNAHIEENLRYLDLQILERDKKSLAAVLHEKLQEISTPFSNSGMSLEFLFQSALSICDFGFQVCNKYLYKEKAVGDLIDEFSSCCNIALEITNEVNILINQSEEIWVEPELNNLLAVSYETFSNISMTIELLLKDLQDSFQLDPELLSRRPNFSFKQVEPTLQFRRDAPILQFSNLNSILNLSELLFCEMSEIAFRLVVYERENECKQKRNLYRSSAVDLRIKLHAMKNELLQVWRKYKESLWSSTCNQNNKIELELTSDSATKFLKEHRLLQNTKNIATIAQDFLELMHEVDTASNVLLYVHVAESAEPQYLNLLSETYKQRLKTLSPKIETKLELFKRAIQLEQALIEAISSPKLNITPVTDSTSLDQERETQSSNSDCEYSEEAALEFKYENHSDIPLLEEQSQDYCINAGEHDEVFELCMLRDPEELKNDQNELENDMQNYRKEVAAAQRVVLYELKEVLLPRKEKMTKRESEAYKQKYGTELSDNYESENSDLYSQPIAKNSCFGRKGTFSLQSLAGKENTMTNISNQINSNISTKSGEHLANQQQCELEVNNYSHEIDLNVMNFRVPAPLHRPMQDEYTLGDKEYDDEDDDYDE